ncbi:hypothetical protein, partial [Neisseria meningitidis]|uniref:hypothetical protein n=1 Tax=Neisseria meningitidis TaxID=487 RepID=UPI00396B0726
MFRRHFLCVDSFPDIAQVFFQPFPFQTKKHRRQPMPLPLQVPLFFIRGQHWFGWAFWCGRTDRS